MCHRSSSQEVTSEMDIGPEYMQLHAVIGECSQDRLVRVREERLAGGEIEL